MIVTQREVRALQPARHHLFISVWTCRGIYLSPLSNNQLYSTTTPRTAVLRSLGWSDRPFSASRLDRSIWLVFVDTLGKGSVCPPPFYPVIFEELNPSHGSIFGIQTRLPLALYRRLKPAVGPRLWGPTHTNATGLGPSMARLFSVPPLELFITMY